MGKFSLKKQWISTDGWRGRYEPLYYVAGANDTGSYSDSPCPTAVCKQELGLVKQVLKKHKIKYREVVMSSSNVFCANRYVIVSIDDYSVAQELISDEYSKWMKEATRLLYVNDRKEVVDEQK